MTRYFSAAASAALFCTFFVAQASAEEAVMSHPIQAGSLHEGPLDVVSYWVPLTDGAFEVTGTFLSRETGAAPMRVVMALQDGDRTSFAMPGYMSALYSFERIQDEVKSSVDILPVQSVAQRSPSKRVVASAK